MCVFTGKIHWGMGILIWAMLQMGIDTLFLNPIPFMFATMLPDADIKYSKIGKILPLWLIWKHRTFTHTIWALILFSIPFFTYSLKWGILFCSGYFLHLAMDSGTKMSVKWLGNNPKFYTFVTCFTIGCMLIW